MGRVVYRCMCPKCHGSGDMSCPSCGGDGYNWGGGQCYRCYGTGEVTCEKCGGSGDIEEEEDD